MNFRLFPGALVLLGGFAATPLVAQTTVNPFEVSSTLPFQAPRFDIIKDSDYQPAFDEAIKRQLAEVDAIANSSAAPTFDNTIVALERSGRMLDRVNATFTAVVQANSNTEL